MHLSLACLAGCDSDVKTLEVHNDGFSYVSYPGERLPRHHSVMGEQPGKAFTLNWCLSEGNSVDWHSISRKLDAALVSTQGGWSCPCRTSGRKFRPLYPRCCHHTPRHVSGIILPCRSWTCISLLPIMPLCQRSPLALEKADQLTSIRCVPTSSACNCVKSRAVSALGTCLLLASPMSAQSHHLCSPSCNRWAEYLRPSSILTRVGTPIIVSPVPAAVVKEGVSWVYSWQRSKQQTALCATGPRSPSRHTA